MNAAFFDTNILVYAADRGASAKSKRELARQLMTTRSIHLSTQVVMEFYGVLHRKLAYRAEEARAWIRTLLDDNMVNPAPGDVYRALEISQRYHISHWDGLILTAAELSGVQVIYSEDLGHGQTYGKVRVCNPFIEDFLS